MVGYILGISAFVFMFVFDILSMNHKKKSKYIFMISGPALLIIGSILIVRRETAFLLPTSLRIFFGAMVILFLLLFIYSVVIEVGKNTYQYNNKPQLVTDGTYALSRHPGVLWMFGLYSALAFTLAHTELLIAAFVFTTVNCMYVYIQEKIIFTHIFNDYKSYQEDTPFILPNIKSIKAFIYNRQI